MRKIAVSLIVTLLVTVGCQAVPTATSLSTVATAPTHTPLPIAPLSTATRIPPTATSISRSPTPRPTADLVADEGFADQSGWWCQKETGVVDWYCEGGELHVVSKGQSQFRWKGRLNSYRDFTMQVQARFLGDEGAGSLVFRAGGGSPPPMYVFWIFPNGRFSLMKYVGRDRINLVEPRESPAIKKQATNTFRVVAQGLSFTLYANDVELARTADASYSEGIVGIGAADGAHVVFDNFRIWAPQPSATINPYLAAGAREKYSFDELVHQLETPSLLLTFMRNNLSHGGDNYDPVHYGGNAYATAQEVYANGEDDCDGLAEFGACVLSKHGIEAYNVGISILSPLGHNVTGFVNPSDGKMYAINNGQEQLGPFNSWLELAQYFVDRGMAEPNKAVWLFNPCISQTTRDVEKLPHKVIR